MSVLKVNEVQNYNGSSLTLTASTVSTSAQLNTGGNISVTGSLNVSDDSTTRSNLGLGSIATQASDNVTITGGNISNATLANSVTFPTGHILKTTQNTYNSAESAVTTSATPSKVVDGSGNNYWSHTISGMTAGNDVLVHMSFVASSSRSGGSYAITGSAFHIYRDSSLIYTTTDDFMFHVDLNPTGTSASLWAYVNLIFLDTGASSTSHTYYAGYSSWSSSSTTIRSGSTRAPFVCILQEVQQ